MPNDRRPECPTCEYELDTEDTNDALAGDPDHDYFCPRCGGLFMEVEVDA